jgi:hypothetical protein
VAKNTARGSRLGAVTDADAEHDPAHLPACERDTTSGRFTKIKHTGGVRMEK